MPTNKRAILGIQLYNLSNAMDAHEGKRDTYFTNELGNVFMCSVSSVAVPHATLVIEETNTLENPNSEEFILSSNEEVDGEVTLATFIAKSGNAFLCYYYGIEPKQKIYLLVSKYEQGLFDVIS